MTVEKYWESMGYLEDLDKKERAHALRLYETIQDLMENSENFRNVLKGTGVDKLWNSYLPKTYEEWFKCSLNGLGSDAAILKDISMFDDSIWDNLIYEIVYYLIIRCGDAFDIVDLIEALKHVTVKPLMNEEEVTKFKTYRELFGFVMLTVSLQCSTFFEINKILEDLKA